MLDVGGRNNAENNTGNISSVFWLRMGLVHNQTPTHPQHRHHKHVVSVQPYSTNAAHATNHEVDELSVLESNLRVPVPNLA